ncbi:MAG: polyketide cyclase [Rhodospirillales bacterium 70-18]|nr:nuclear transport factor 2 family protein [Rhodospirillales bacterium]OJY65621.1 MAG: polyketide cyclase [Rhodospirillales bacterium 70-18]
MTDTTTLIDRYLAAWNETAPTARRTLVENVFSVDAAYLDPMLQGDGHAGIDAMLAAVQARFAGLRFRRAGTVDAHHDRLRFRWELAPEGGEAVAAGTDFAVLDGDGRMAAVTGFLDLMPAG